ncbi:MAG TPA: hypothetical protein VLW52_07695 [Opitutaceae bacterium]|nr:hypothetical protein [Opitutaceae bacterium]
MSAAPPPFSRTPGLAAVFGAAAAAAALWLWMCWCVFPVSVWNDVRLAPAFALARGVPLYSGANSGAVGTWIYGPLPVLLLWPATLAASAGHALLIAGAVNLLTTVAAIAVVCAAWPVAQGYSLTRSDRFLAMALAIALWPRASWQYLQADNFTVAFGLVGNLLLVRARGPAWRWGAAAFAVAGLACKQTSVGVAIAQIIWLGITLGRAEALRHLGRCLGAGALGALAIGFGLGWNGVWLNLFDLPSRLPWTTEMVRRIVDLAPELTIHLVLPVLVMLLWRRAFWRRDSVLLLPSLAWLCALPPGVASLLKIGGTINSLQSLAYWLPPVLVAALAAARSARQLRWAIPGAALAGLAICTTRLAATPGHPWRPLTKHYRQAEVLAQSFPDQIWFPWNPLVTIYGENRFYHVEDGLYVRFLAGRPLALAHARAFLPPHMCVIALPRGGTDWGIALQFVPPNARRAEFGLWTLYSWPSEAPAGTAAPSPRS